MKNYRTTIVGALAAILITVQPLIETGQIDWEAVGIAALVALFSYLTKDAGVTGQGK